MLEREALSTEKHRESSSIDLPSIYPVGVGSLHPVEARLEDPYFDYSAAALAALTEFSLGARLLVDKDVDWGKVRMSRRIFGLGLCAGGAYTIARPGAVLQELMSVHTIPALAFQNIHFVQYYSRLKSSERTYALRMIDGTAIQIGDGAEFDTSDGSARIYTYPIISDESQKGSISCYVVKKGGLQPHISTDNTVVATSPDVVFSEIDTPMVASLNATAPAATHFGNRIRATYKERLPGSENTIIYGSSSLFIPASLDTQSPVWMHAQNRVSQKNTTFPELTLRSGDKSHCGLGYRNDGFFRIMPQHELIDSISKRRLSPDLAYAALQQFCFDPREIDRLPEGFRWGKNYHRNASLLLQSTDGTQVVVGGSPHYFLSNSDYGHLVRQLSERLHMEFDLAACLDVGMGGGFMTYDNNEIRKYCGISTVPWHEGEDVFDKAYRHTTSIHLVHVR